MIISYKKFFLTILVLTAGVANAQLVVDNTSFNPTQLVQNVLVGQGVTVSNVTFNGVAATTISQQVGSFTAPNTTLPIQDGLILGTGDVTVAEGPNTSGSSTLGTGGGGTDPDLNAISTVTIYDQAILEFDFVPNGDTITFNYSFASEEYDEFVCSGFNDIFGFFISGPGFAGPYTNGAENIALIPGTTTPVAINTVNLGVAGSSGTASNCSAIDPNWTSYNVYYNSNSGNDTEYDGYTVSLQAVAEVQCGQTYHIKLAIADGGDGSYDSGVFLESGSFTSESDFQIDINTLSGSDTLIEGCGAAEFIFGRLDTAGVDTLFFDITGNAQNGIDYLPIPDSILFQSGQDSVSLLIFPILDGVAEGTDTLNITVYSVNNCGDTIATTGTVLIVDPDPVLTTAPDDVLTCPDLNFPISATASGGLPPYNYNWSNGMTGPNINVSVTQTDTFYVNITDACAITNYTDTVIVELNYVDLIVTASNDTTVSCPGDPVNMSVSATGGVAPYSYSWSSGGSTTNESAIANADTVFYASVTDGCNYTVTDSVVVTVNDNGFSVLAVDTSVVCPGDQLTLESIVSGGNTPYSYSWDNGTTTPTNQVTVPADSEFYLTVTDDCGRSITDTATVTVPVYGPISVTAPGDDTLCLGAPFGGIAGATGGEGNYSFVWAFASDTLYTGNPAAFEPDESGVYDVIAIDACGNIGTADFFLEMEGCEITIPNVFTPNGDGVNDVFHIINIEKRESVVQIYNRWGQQVFEGENYQNDWNADNVSDGTYYYIVTLDNGEEQYEGVVTIIRND